jgi:hypothetical protein
MLCVCIYAVYFCNTQAVSGHLADVLETRQVREISNEEVGEITVTSGTVTYFLCNDYVIPLCS